MKKFIEEVSVGMTEVQRWQTYPTLLDETLSDHNNEIMWMAYLFSLEIEESDTTEVMERALVHDLEEVITSDVPRYVKRNTDSMKEEFDHLERDAVEEITKETDHSDRIRSVWERSKDQTIEGQIIAAADILAAIYGGIREYRLGNDHLIEEMYDAGGIEDAIEICEGIEPAEKILNDLLQEIDHE